MRVTKGVIKMPEIVLFKSEEPANRAKAAGFLRALADKVETGEVLLKQGETEVALEIPEALVLEVKAEREEKAGKPTKHSLEVEIEWAENARASGGVELG